MSNTSILEQLAQQFQPSADASSVNLKAALEHAAQGRPVFPLHGMTDGRCGCGAGAACKSPGKHPRVNGWQEAATTSAEQVREWWEGSLSTNIGIPTGARSGLIVVDVDPKNTGVKTFEDLETAHGALPKTWKASTGGGGFHLVFRYPSEGHFPNTTGKLGSGIDTRGEGGYIVAPGSLHLSGNRYAWADGHAPGETELADIPEWLAARLLSTPPGSTTETDPLRGTFGPADLDDLTFAGKAISDIGPAIEGSGGRSKTVAVARILIHDYAFTDEEALLVARPWNAMCQPPWHETELLDLFHSVGKSPAEKPYGSSRPAIDFLQHIRRMRREPGANQDLESDADEGDAESPPLPTVRLGTDTHRVVADAIEALARLPNVFVHDGKLCEVSAGAPSMGVISATPAHIEPFSFHSLAVTMTSSAVFAKGGGKGGPVPAEPPVRAVHGVLAKRNHRGVRRLAEILTSPIVRPDGTLLQDPGYDEGTGLFLAPVQQIRRIPDHVSREDALAALGRLCEVVSDFPFEAEHHRSAWLALVLTPTVRWVMGESPTPLFMIEANAAGSGKTLLADIAARIVTGLEPSTFTWPGDEAERAKTMFAIARQGHAMAVFDNIEGVLGGAALNMALTSARISSRLLGVSEILDPSLHTVMVATGNGMRLGPDVVRRTISIKLLNKLEDPAKRSGFKIKDLKAWTAGHRGEIMADALTVCRGYFCAGQPKTELPAIGSFERWEIVRQILTWLVQPDPALGQEDLKAFADTEGPKLDAIFFAIRTLSPGASIQAGEILVKAVSNQAVKARLLEHFGFDGLLPDASRFGAALSKFNGRRMGDWVLSRGKAFNPVKWKVTSAKEAGYEA